MRENWVKYPTEEQRLEAKRRQNRESRMRRPRTHCKRNHEFTPENTILADGHRRCRKCRMLAQQRRVRPYKKKVKYVQVTCPLCKVERTLTDRNARKILTGESSGRCLACRYGWNDKLVSLRPGTEDYVQWWRDRGFTPDDAHVIWSAISNGLPSTLTDVLMGSMGARITEQDMTREAA